MQIQFENWGIVEMNYSLLNNKERREENSFDLKFKKVFSDKNKNFFRIIFYLTLNDKKFNLDIEAMFNFVTDEEISEEFKSSHFFKINAPAIAYPYLRAFVSNLTLQSGVAPVILPTINFVKFENPID
ncbi:protein-export chaperone SecB [Capnocytophaga leadbetteri]|mgnify:FL=1|uniref:protein-export chaperone SecB n=1 Tax=Capnocytophaga leadbetteri TaxID=327575 RepID=UPI0028E19101|nr:protein-export chaperone SecB [Capnocytophaga leadbetteri]